MQTGHLEFLVNFSGFTQFANRWIASTDLRCGHKVREYMKENTLERIDFSKKGLLEPKDCKTESPQLCTPRQSNPGLPCESKKESTHSGACDEMMSADVRHHKSRKISRRPFRSRWHPKRKPNRCIFNNAPLSLTVTAPPTRRVIPAMQQCASLHLKFGRGSSSLAASTVSVAQTSKLNVSSSSPSQPPLHGRHKSALLTVCHPNSINGQVDANSQSDEQRLTARAYSSDESSGSGLRSFDSGLLPSPPTPRSESGDWSSGKPTPTTRSTQAPGKLRRNSARRLRRSLRASFRHQSRREEPSKRPAASVQSAGSYTSEGTSEASIVNYDRNSFPLTRTVRRSNRIAILCSSKQQRAMQRSSEQSGACESVNESLQDDEEDSPPHSFSDGSESGSMCDSVSELSPPDLENSFASSPQSGPTVCPLSMGMEIGRNRDPQLASTRSCSSYARSILIGGFTENATVPFSPMAPTSICPAVPASLPLASAPDVCVVAVPVCGDSEEGQNIPPAGVKPFTLEDRQSVISHGEYMIFSQNTQHLCRRGIEEVTIPPASIGVSSNANGRILSNYRNNRQPVALPALASALPPNSVVRRETAHIERPRNGLVLHRDPLPVGGTTSSYLTCIGDILVSKRPTVYTPAKAANPHYQILLDALEFAVNQVTEGKEAYVYIENTVDDSRPPFSFHYITERIHSENVPPRKPRSSLETCDCSEDCLTNSSQCCCTTELTAMPGYFRNGRMKGNHRMPIAECWTSCKCGPHCSNRVVQRGRWVPLCIFRTENRGWGVKSVAHIPKGTFLAAYVGEVISDDEAEERGRDNSAQGLTYLFDLDYWSDLGTSVFTVDATHCGNVSRFFNHSVSMPCCYGSPACVASYVVT